MSTPEPLQRFRTVLSGRLGLHFDERQLPWLGAVLRQRLHGRAEADYLQALEQAPTLAELDALAAEVTVGETFFFRNVEKFDALRRTVLPALMKTRRDQRRLRVLSAGCSSGEEAYSLVISLQTLGLELQSWDWQIQAFDINPAALAQADAGRYGAWSLRATSEVTRRHWFHQRGGQFELAPALRRKVSFEQRNICVDDAEFWRPGAFDVVFCRNMLMYLEPQAQRAAVARIASALAPDGYLFIGDAESLRGLSDAFELRQSEGSFYYQRAGQPLPDTSPVVRPLQVAPPPAVAQLPAGRDRLFELLRQERHVEALSLASSLGNAEPDNAELLLVQALLLSQQGRVEEAQQACERLLLLQAGPALTAAGHYVAALCRESLGDAAGAEQRYGQSARLDPSFAMPVLRLGLLARRRGDLPAQRQQLERANRLLRTEDEQRLLLFGGGFGRAALVGLCGSGLPAEAA